MNNIKAVLPPVSVDDSDLDFSNEDTESGYISNNFFSNLIGGLMGLISDVYMFFTRKL
jgi:hypothetical protein